MDVWIVAAAAGAGYVVQNLKNLTRGKSRSLDLSSDNLNIVRPESLRDVFTRHSFAEEMSGEGEKFCGLASDSNSLTLFPNNEDISSRFPLDDNENFVGDSLPHPSMSVVGFGFNYGRKRRSKLKSRRINSRFIKPQTSLGSCLMAQLYEEYAEIEECTYSLQRPILRPFLVSDGSRIISKAPYELLSEAHSHEKKTVCGVPRLPNLVPLELKKKATTMNTKEHVLRRTNSSKIEQGTSDRALLFYLGLTMGIACSFLANKQEVEKFNNLLKQTENLVQDLQEELEMKDSLTVKELATEDNESQDVHNDCSFDDTIHALSLEQSFSEGYCDKKAEEKSLSNIEAELESELQRLESNMNASSLEGKLCNVTMLDLDLADTNEDGSPSSTPCSAHYAVSPRELSLRLHQLIQSRLEQRVKELETALANSQIKVKHMESEHVHPWREPSSYKSGIRSTLDSPIEGNGQEPVDQPVIINLSGEALAAYNEAYEELSKVSESDEEDLQVGFENGYQVKKGSMGRHAGHNGNQETAFDRTEEYFYSMANDFVCSSGDEVEDGEDEMEKLLIRQIVEKAKEGSPAVLKAQRAFLLLADESEH